MAPAPIRSSAAGPQSSIAPMLTCSNDANRMSELLRCNSNRSGVAQAAGEGRYFLCRKASDEPLGDGNTNRVPSGMLSSDFGEREKPVVSSRSEFARTAASDLA